MGKETMDFECRWGQAAFGVEVTTRAGPEAASALNDLLEKGQQDGPDVSVTLTRTSTLLFAESPARTAAIADQVIARIKEYLTSAAGQPVPGRIPGRRARPHRPDPRWRTLLRPRNVRDLTFAQAPASQTVSSSPTSSSGNHIADRVSTPALGNIARSE